MLKSRPRDALVKLVKTVEIEDDRYCRDSRDCEEYGDCKDDRLWRL